MAADRFEWRIAITPPEIFPGEGAEIAALLRSGLFTHVHLRHPDASRREMLDLIEQIPQGLHTRLRLHGHFDLAWDFNLGGLHLNSRCPEPPRGYTGSLSCSCHSLEEVAKAAAVGRFDFVTLSPIFDSISKPGYRGAFPHSILECLRPLPVKVVALGGVTPERIPLLDSLPIAGFAMLGAAWPHLNNN